MMSEEELWGRGEQRQDQRSTDWVSDGQVVTWDGRPVHFRTLLKRQWGWPRRAAYAAADHLLSEAAHFKGTAVLHVNNPGRIIQQMKLLSALPDLQRDLLIGLAGSAIREASSASQEMDSLLLQFDKTMTDDGMVRGVLNALAQRLGCSIEDLRKACHFNMNTREVVIRIGVSEFGC